MPPDPLILAFDTSAAHCAAALLSGNQITVSRHEPMAKGQAERLLGLLDDVLSEAAVSWSDLTALGVGIGPGNFTGIRISVAAARGLAMGLGCPLVGVSSLEAAVEGADRPVMGIVDARAGRVYAQAFPQDTAPRLLPLADLDPALPRRGWGEGATPPVWPMAEAIARIAARRAAPDLPLPGPLYVRAPDAAPAKDRAPIVLP